MTLSPKAIKYLAIGIIAVVGVVVIGSWFWDLLKTAIGLLIGVGLVYIGVRVLLGKGLPKPIEKVIKKATDKESDKNASE